MILGTAVTGDSLSLDLDALIGSHLCVAANSGGGKSGAIRKLLEITHGQVQHIVLDAEDEFYTLRERYDYVIAGGGNASPAALAIADLLDRVNPARLTWTQAAALTGRKATGGNFNAARKWLRESGRLIEDGDLVRSAADAPAGMTRAEALDLWRGVLTNPAPRMIDALGGGPLTREELGAAIGAQPRGGNFNNGLAQLRRNGVAVEVGGRLQLARPLPGEAE